MRMGDSYLTIFIYTIFSPALNSK